jgi:hypothetical protein
MQSARRALRVGLGRLSTVFQCNPSLCPVPSLAVDGRRTHGGVAHRALRGSDRRLHCVCRRCRAWCQMAAITSVPAPPHCASIRRPTAQFYALTRVETEGMVRGGGTRVLWRMLWSVAEHALMRRGHPCACAHFAVCLGIFKHKKMRPSEDNNDVDEGISTAAIHPGTYSRRSLFCTLTFIDQNVIG